MVVAFSLLLLVGVISSVAEWVGVTAYKFGEANVVDRSGGDHRQRIGDAAMFLGVSVPTLRRWDHLGKLSPAYRTPGNHRLYALSSLRELLGQPVSHRLAVGYARVSSHDQKKDLATQAHRLEQAGADMVLTD